MKKFLIIFFVVIGFSLQSQVDVKIPQNNEIELYTDQWYNRKVSSLMVSFAGGILHGYHQVNRHRYEVLAKRHPNLGPMFGPDSWKNKWALDENGDPIPNDDVSLHAPVYKERFLGSSTIFVSFTDADHGLKTLNHLSLFAAPMVSLYNVQSYDNKFHLLIEILAHFIVRSAGFTLIHDIVYKP